MTEMGSLWLGHRRGIWTLAAAWFGLFGCLLMIMMRTDRSASVFGYILSFSCLAVLLTLAAVVRLHRCGRARDRFFMWLLLSGLTVGILPLFELAFAVAALFFGFAQLVLVSALGVRLGREVQQRSHVWPLMIVALGVDAISLLTPTSFTHGVLSAVTEQPKLHLFLFSLPVPGVGVEPILGLGDGIFTGFLLGAALRLELSITTACIGVGFGYFLCLVALILTANPIPALVFIAPSFALAFGRALKPNPKDPDDRRRFSADRLDCLRCSAFLRPASGAR